MPALVKYGFPRVCAGRYSMHYRKAIKIISRTCLEVTVQSMKRPGEQESLPYRSCVEGDSGECLLSLSSF